MVCDFVFGVGFEGEARRPASEGKEEMENRSGQPTFALSLSAELQVLFVEAQHGPRTVSVDHIHADSRSFPIIEEDESHELVALALLDGFHLDDQALPVLFRG